MLFDVIEVHPRSLADADLATVRREPVPDASGLAVGGADDGDDGVNWSGCSVLMKIQPGSCYTTNNVEPKLVWTTL